MYNLSKGVEKRRIVIGVKTTIKAIRNLMATLKPT